MLTASAAAPKPRNWRGVREGLARAKAALAAGRYAEACDLARDVLEFAPMEAGGWHLLGKALQAMGEHAQALECFAHAADLYKERQATENEPPASVHLAKLLWRQGEKEAARGMVAQLIAKHGKTVELTALLQAWEEEQ